MSTRIFNITVGAIVWKWICQVLGDEATSLGMGENLWRFLAAFYADNGLIQSRDLVLLQSFFDILIGLFDRVGLQTNTTKMKGMVCVLEKIQEPLTMEVYNYCREGLINRSDWQHGYIQCETCGVHMLASSLKTHM